MVALVTLRAGRTSRPSGPGKALLTTGTRNTLRTLRPGEDSPGLGSDLLSFPANVRTSRGLLKVRRLTRRVELFREVLLLLLLRLPIHRISRSKPLVVHCEIQAREPEKEGQQREPEDQHVAAPGSPLGPFQRLFLLT